uniref:Protein IQ-DOMAIN 1 n=1 Tax=Ananas comosus var. bracteatus TaxID=296719 RepID=A0A6V7NGF2_ANACO|nr:unnamed protein product [Ananas comosus var. bracteatus]
MTWTPGRSSTGPRTCERCCESKENKSKSKSKKRWFGKVKHSEPPPTESAASDGPLPPQPPPPIPAEEIKEVRLTSAENEQNKHVYSVALASAVAAEAAAVAAQAAAEVVRLTATTRVSAKSREEVAAIKIQTAFRGYKARRALRALRGLVRLKSLVDGNAVRRQTANALRSMQTLARLQSQIRSRRIRMSEENLALQRQLQLKRERELEKLKIGENWDDSLQSKEKIEANLLSKHEAAIRRERTLAYAFSHQWKNTSRTANPTFIDPNNPQWGWSWLERWMAVRPWESHTTQIKHRTMSPLLQKRTITNHSSIEPLPRATDRPVHPAAIPFNPPINDAKDQTDESEKRPGPQRTICEACTACNRNGPEGTV